MFDNYTVVLLFFCYITRTFFVACTSIILTTIDAADSGGGDMAVIDE